MRPFLLLCVALCAAACDRQHLPNTHWANTPPSFLTDSEGGHYQLGLREDGVVVWRKGE